jgi:hypothetical protein
MATKRTIEFEGREITVHDFTYVIIENSPTLLRELLSLEEEHWDNDDIEIWDIDRAEELLECIEEEGEVSKEDIEEFAENIKLLEAEVVDCVLVRKF